MKKLNFDAVFSFFKENNVELVSKDYVNAHNPLIFKCTCCGAEALITWNNIKSGYNKSFLCTKCNKKAKPKLEEISKEFEDRGANLISKEYKNARSNLEFLCSKCHKLWYITYNNYKAGKNKGLLCDVCLKDEMQKKEYSCYTQEYVEKLFERKNSKLLSIYLNNKTNLKFLCTKCDSTGEISLSSLLRGSNSALLCEKCLKGNLYSPSSSYGHSRKIVDRVYFDLVKEFFNIKDKESFSTHHILPFSSYEQTRTSICNGFPLNKYLHSNSYIEQGIRNPFHMREEYLNITNFPDDAKLQYHTYQNFKFLDLNSYLITEIITDFNYERNYLFNKKAEASREDKVYIPIYFEEIMTEDTAKIIYSMIRSKLYRKYKDIYKYTGQDFKRYYARDLLLKVIKGEESREFFSKNHIQGNINAEVTYALLKGDEIIFAASFGKSRMNRNYQYELYRMATKLNTQVVAGANRVLKNFIRDFLPESIISYCDIRFSDFDYRNTVYPKLGFKYLGLSEPGYKYIDPSINRIYSRFAFQKFKLKDKLKNFDASLTERENMLRNGFGILYDCGNFRFGWHNSDNI